MARPPNHQPVPNQSPQPSNLIVKGENTTQNITLHTISVGDCAKIRTYCIINTHEFYNIQLCHEN